jgi:hypothetical protein
MKIMKRINKNLFFLLSFFLILGACEKKELVTINEGAKPVVSLSTSQLVLDENTPDDVALTVSWTEPDFGYQAAPSYSVLMDLASGDFSNAQVFPAGTDLEKNFTHAELNSKLLALGVQAGTPTDIQIKVEVKLSQQVKIYSDPVTLTVTAYSSYLDLSTEWGIVGSATPGGWGNPDLPDLPMYKTNTPGVLVAYVGLQTGEIKFRLNNDWTVNYGDDGADGTLEQNGANIPVTEGTYKITVDTNALTYTIEPYSWGIVGSATPNGWNGPDIQFYYNPANDNWVAAATLTDGEIKFRFNNDWGTNYGDDGADGTLEPNGANIQVTAGQYIITMDLNAMSYTIEQADLWGLVGSATPNGWNGPDTKFIPEFGPNEGKFYIYRIALSDGEIKVRLNDDWGTNYGDDGNDGTLEQDGANIPVTAGNYYVKLDFTASPPTIKLIQWP